MKKADERILGVKNNDAGKTLESFGVNLGVYAIIWDTCEKIWYTYTANRGDKIQKK
jgi:hypothetical protein